MTFLCPSPATPAEVLTGSCVAQAADLRICVIRLAAGVGFEPTNGLPLRAFKARAIGH